MPARICFTCTSSTTNENCGNANLARLSLNVQIQRARICAYWFHAIAAHRKHRPQTKAATTATTPPSRPPNQNADNPIRRKPVMRAQRFESRLVSNWQPARADGRAFCRIRKAAPEWMDSYLKTVASL
ncbi:hypothetical protein Bxe_C1146 [Paraburkholderia xenovorans LB400]|uniref:Uncharacterized protein n=1 Tax=Paraburkholderia xenovorans (strain LB400) TaxID=266265 RepID=Q13FX8_PARXL|nr:hypothetical protein Bxe_C1146 [Paraburkholderia xenovorans LB400]